MIEELTILFHFPDFAMHQSNLNFVPNATQNGTTQKTISNYKTETVKVEAENRAETFQHRGTAITS